MNKSRRMLTLVAQGLARAGTWVVLPDLFGTGESEGDFEDGSWSRWKDDLRGVAEALRREGWIPGGLLGVRTGALLGLDAARECGWSLQRTILWAPVVDGTRFVTQFLRMRVAASLMDDQRETVAGIRERLAAGQTVEVAGYGVSGRLVRDLENLAMGDVLGSYAGSVHWFEVQPGEGTDLLPASAACVKDARSRGLSVEVVMIKGEPFWSTTEVVQIAGLVHRTVETFASVA